MEDKSKGIRVDEEAATASWGRIRDWEAAAPRWSALDSAAVPVKTQRRRSQGQAREDGACAAGLGGRRG